MLDKLVTGHKWNNVFYGTTTRYMAGVSEPPFDSFNLGLHCGDNPEHAQANRALLNAALPNSPIWLNQVHGTEVLDADRPFDYPAKADAAVTTCDKKVLAIMTADCLPVVLADEEGTIVGAAHAGWRGLQAGILERTVDLMRSKKPNAHFKAWIGPAISQKVFEVGAEVYDAFVSQNSNLAPFFEPGVVNKYFANLSGIANMKLKQIGVNMVEESNECTYLDKQRYFSYRRENPTGRIVTLVWKGV
ncbi:MULTISPECIES: peptidoglycan editing factor PgeF [Pelistega]|uniref:peptidoglycan editing factor PgeF n=1 Tax=Pelistega TaxID=106146 RepID=UPI00040EA022|nr:MULTISPECIES: peptidoglycan editing factor PgeF [Pelistega]